jgi:hypothetical protein
VRSQAFREIKGDMVQYDWELYTWLHSPFLQKSSRGPHFVLDYIGVVSYYRSMESNKMNGYELIDKYKTEWFEALPAGCDWPITDDATDEAIQREFSQRGLASDDEDQVSGGRESEYREAVFCAMSAWHHPNVYATRSNDSVTYDYKAIERDLVVLGATPAEADALTEVLHVEGWGGVEDSSDPQLANMLEWLRENRPVKQ